MNNVALTTFDNPYDPFDDFTSWFLFDVQKGYNSCAYLARIAKISDELSEQEINEEIEKAMNINFYSCVYGVKTFLPVLLTQDDPGIINVDSSAALMTLAGTSMYSSSKAALKGFTEALRVEFKGKCYVGLVCPGFTKTDIFRDQSNAGGKGQKVMDMISTDCDLMVKMIMFGIEHKRPMMVHGLDAHAMSIFNRLLPVAGSELFSAIMKMADIDLFSEVFDD